MTGPEATSPADLRTRARSARLAAGLLRGALREAALAEAAALDARASEWVAADVERQRWSEAALVAHVAGDRAAWREAWAAAVASHVRREAARVAP